MVSKAREIFVLATERDATTRRRAAFILFSFLTSAGVRENRCCVACEERASVFEEIEIEGKIAPEVRGSTETGRTRVTDSIAWVNPRDFNGGASFFRSTARPFFFVFADCATGQKCSFATLRRGTYARYFTSALRFRTRET